MGDTERASATNLLTACNRRELNMSNFEYRDEGRKAWIAPEIRQLRAGSAEAGSGTIPDGGPPASPRS